MQDEKRIKVLLAENHAIVREGLRLLFEKKPYIELIFEAEDGRVVVENVRKVLPDVVVMDITMSNLNDIEATRQIVNEFPHIKVIALSIHSNNRFVADMLEVGAAGYVLKECLFEELVQAIQDVNSGKTSKQIALKLHVSTKTVDANRHKIMEKLDAHTIVDLVKIAINENLISIDLDQAKQTQLMVH